MLHTRAILFIDDHPNLVKPLLAQLADAAPHWSVVQMDDAETGLVYAGEARLDVIFLNLRVAGDDGQGVLEALRSLKSVENVPIVAFAERFTAAMKQKALDLGAADLLSPPITLADLRVRIGNILAVRNYQDETAFLSDCVETKVRQRTSQLEFARLDVLWRLAKVCEYRDSETGDHVLRVGHCCRIVAEAMGKDREFVEKIFATSPLHDIGKIGIPDAIVLKRGTLNSEEFRVMSRHCEIGSNILLDAPKDAAFVHFRFRGRRIGAIAAECGEIKRMASTIALAHHEWWDGSGYPRGLAGETIPIEARIVAMADVYDALRSARPYKQAIGHRQTMKIMRAEVGSHFDPDVAAAFEESLDPIREAFATLSIDDTGPSRTSAA